MRHSAALLPACLAIGAAASVLAGQDANWDLLNYHLYNGYALLHGRFHADLLAAGMQSYLNPLLDASYAALALGPLNAYPRALAATMGLWFGALLYLSARLARLLHPGQAAAAFAGVLLAGTGVATVAQVGTTTDEIQVAVFMLAGLLLLLREGAAPHRASALFAGLSFGVAAGLKLTALAYAPAAGLAVAAAVPRGRWVVAFSMFGAGWLLGFAALDGWWAWMLWQRFESPAFPLFNAVFRSPRYPPASLLDDRFLPRGLLQWLLYPVQWLAEGGPSPGELPVKDPRFALALGLALLSVPAALLRLAAPSPAPSPALSSAQRAALVFLATGYVIWLATSAIIRYAVVIEVMAGLLIPLLLARLLPGPARAGALVATIALVLLATRHPVTPRIPYGPRSFQADMGRVQPGTLIVVTFRGPSAHVLAALPHQDVRVINLGDTVLSARGWPLHDAVVHQVREHAGPITVITQGNVQGRFPELGEIGLDPVLANCRPVVSTFVPAGPTGIHACDARKAERPRLESPFWRQAAQRYRTLLQPRDSTMALSGAAYLDAAGPAARGTRFIDWTDLLWSGVRGAGAPLPRQLDPGTLYVIGPEHVGPMAALLDPASDSMGRVDGLIVVAPGWRRCAGCIALFLPVRLAAAGAPLAPGDILTLGPQATATGLLDGGWWPQEQGGIWSKEEAALSIPLAPGLPEGAVLVLNGTVFGGPGRPVQRVVADVPNQAGSERQEVLAGEGAIHLPIRPGWIIQEPGGPRLHLRLRFPDAASPAELGLSPDPRRLGLAPSFLRIDASAPAF